MHSKRHGSSTQEHHGGHRWHHDPEQRSGDRGRRHGHGGRHDHGRHGLHSSRKLSGQDLQLIILALLAKETAHGYEIIKSLEDHSHGLYVPSPGMIYPALTYLEEIGYASVELAGTKKRYSLTEGGRNHYEQNRDNATSILNDMERIGAQMAQARQTMESGTAPEQGESGTKNDELAAARQELRRAQHKNEPYTTEEALRVVEILNRAAADIRDIL